MIDVSVDAAVAEHPKLIRTYRTRAYLSRAGHIRLDDVLWPSNACSTTLPSRSGLRPGSNIESASRSRSRTDHSLRFAKTFPTSKDR